jgi:putative hemolysin
MEIIILVLLTFINGFFALSEIAIVSSRRQRIEKKASEGSKGALIVLSLLRKPELFLSSIQVGITLIGIIAGAYGGATLTDDIAPVFQRWPSLQPFAHELSLIIIIGLITYFTILIGELIPKTIALGNPEKFAISVAPVIKYFSLFTAPVVHVLSFSTKLVNRLFGIRATNNSNISEEEIRYMLKMAGKEGAIQKSEIFIHENIFSFLDKKARNFITHRREIDWIDVSAPIESILNKIRLSAHSKFPVCNKRLDNIIGILNVKTLLSVIGTSDFKLADIIDKPIFIPENTHVLEILKVFKENRQYMAIVVDEYGGITGLVTLHDLLEYIVGDLPDRDETDEIDVIRREDGSCLVNGSVSIAALNSELNEHLIEELPDRYTTFAGFILEHLNRIPSTGDHFHHKNWRIEVVDMDGNKIDKLLLSKELTGESK